MPFCSNCGHQLAEGAKFCFECGAKVNIPVTPKVEQRKTVYEGEIHKCPNCGEVLDSFKSRCPACDCEIRGLSSSSAVKELASKLEKIESQAMPHIEEKKSVMKQLVGKDLKKENEVEEARARFEEHKRQQKINLIINFSVPNTKEDILEFMILASTNIDVKKDLSEEVTKAWLQKMEQVYEKAKLLMGDTDDISQIKNIYDTKKKQIKDKRKRTLIYVFCGIAGYFFLMGLLWNPKATIGITIGVLVLVVGGFILFKRRKSLKNARG